MKKLLLTLILLPITLFTSSQTADNPFEKLGYTPLMATLTRGEFEEFHDQKDIVEIGSVLYNTRTKQVVGFLDEGQTTLEVSSATIAMSIDPLCEKYYWVSPYTYCLNNPIKFIDPDGRKVVGTDGKPVSYSAEGGWSKNASASTQRIGNSMLGTDKGTERLNAMISSKAEITMNLSSKVETERGLVLGRVDNVKLDVKNGKVDVKSMDLTVFEGSIKAILDPDGKYVDNMLEGLTTEDAIGAVAGHESEHTETSNIQQQWDNQYKGANNNVETVPNKTKQEIADELKNKEQ